MKISIERALFVGLAMFLIFTQINVDSKVGDIFQTFLILSVLMYMMDILFGNNIQFKIESRTGERLISIMWALGAFVFLMLFSIAINLAGITDINSSLSLYSQYLPYYAESLPSLAGNPWFTLLNFGLLIAITESLFFLRVFEFILDAVNESTNTKILTIKKLAAIFLISAAFALFHITAKGISNTPAYVMTFAFMAISCILVLKRRQLFEAIAFHIIANTTAVVHNLQLSFMNPYIISVMVALILYVIVSRFDVLSIARKVGI